MAQGGRIDYTIGFKTDKAGLTELRNQLNELGKMTATDILNLKPNLNMNQARSEMMKLREAVDEVQSAMNSAFNTDLGVLNIQKLQENLGRLNLTEIQNRFSSAGTTGQKAFLNISKAALTTNVQLKQTSNIVDKLGQTFVNTIKWQISSKAVNSFTGAIQQAYGYVQHLDTSLNDIRIVTNKSAEDMADFAVQANKAAKALGQSTTNYTEASLIYYQQGLSDEEVAARAETTLKAANVTGQSASQVSEQLTAVWNGYQIQAENTEMAVDKLAAVAATTASDLEELSTGMSKVASSANAMGVDMDQLNAQISTIISVTRQAPESVGTALKTIYARMGDLKLGGEDEEGIKLGDVSGTLDRVGIAVLDANGNLREMGDIIEEVAAKWQTWTEAQQIAIAEVMAGKRQYNNLIALFENWDMYTSALETSKNATGTLQQQQDIYMESTKAHLQQLKTQWEDLYDSILDPKAINTVADGLNKILTLVTRVIDSIGGGKTLLTGLIALISTKFSKQISGVFTPFIENMKKTRENALQLQTLLKNNQIYAENNNFGSKAAEAMQKAQKEMSQYWNLMSNEQINASQEAIREIGYWTQKQEEIEKTTESLREYLEVSGTADQKRVLNLNQQMFGDTGYLSSANIQKTLLDNAEKGVIKLNQSLKDINKTYNKYHNSVSEAKTDNKKFENSIKNITNSVKAMKEALAKSKATDSTLVDEHSFDKAEKAIERIEKRVEAIKQGKTTKFFTEQDKQDLKIIEDLVQQTTGKYEQLANTANTTSEATAKIAEQWKLLGIDILSVQAKADAVSKILGGITSYIFAIQSIGSIGNIWSNDDLTTGQKIFQTLTNLALVLPMVSAAIKSVSAGMAVLTAAKKASTAATIEEGVVEGVVNKKRKTWIQLIWGETIATTGLTGSVIAATAALTALVAVIGVASVVSAKRKQHLEEEAQSAKKAADASRERLAAAKEEQEHIEEIEKKYDELNEQLEKHEITTRDAKQQIYDLCKEYDLQDLAIQVLISEYEDLDGMINKVHQSINENNLETTKDVVNQSKRQARTELNKQTTLMDKKLDVGAGGGEFLDALNELSNTEGLGDITLDRYGHIDTDVLIELYAKNYEKLNNLIELYRNTDSAKQVEKLEKFIGESEEGLSAYRDAVRQEEEYSIIDQVNEKTSQNAIESVEDYLKLKEELKESFKDSYLSEDEIDGIIINACEGIDEIKDYVQQGEIGESLRKNVKEGFEEGLKEDLKKWVQEGGLTETEIISFDSGRDYSGSSSKGYSSSNSKDYSSSRGHFGNPLEDVEKNSDKIVDYLKSTNQLEVQKYLDEDDWYNILSLDSLEEQLSTVQNIIDEKSKQAAETAKENVLSTMSDTSTLFTSIFDEGREKGVIDTTSEEYQILSERLEEIKENYPELINEIEVFNEEGLIGTEHWTQAAYKLQDAIDNLEFQSLNDNFKTAKDNLDNLFTDYRTEGSGDHQYQVPIEAIPDDTEFQDAMDEILNADYAINVEIHSDAERDFDQLVDSLESADEMASKIGEDFIVAADDIRELNNTFPGILEGIEYLGDGTIQLNQEIAESAIAAATQEEASSTNATIKKLENSATELRAKADVYESMAEIADKANKEAAYSDKAKTDISKKLKEIETENDTIATDNILDNAALVADDAARQGEVAAWNWTKAYESAAQASSKFAQVAVENARQAALGPNGKPVKSGDFGFNYKGKNATASEAKQAAQFQTTADGSIDWANQAQTYRDTAEALRAQANDIEGMIVAAGAKATEILKKNGGVGKSSASDSGSGSGSSKDADQEDYVNYQVDIYHKVNAELEDIEEKLGRIQTVGDHTWGKSQVDVLNQEKELLDENIDKLEEKIELQQKDLSVRKKQLENEGFTFSDDSAVILNREEQIKALWDGYDAMVAQYNAMSADAQESYKATLEAEKDRVQQISDALDRYEDVYGEYQSALDDWLDKQYEIIETQIEAFNSRVEIQLELDEAERDWITFKKEVIDDIEDIDFGGRIAASLATLTTFLGPDGEIAMLTSHLSESITEIGDSMRGLETDFTHDGVFDTEAARKQLEDYRDKLMDAVRAAKEEVDEVSETYLDALDDAKDKIDKQIEGWENIGDQIQHDIDLIKKVGGEKSYEALARLYDQQHQNNLETIQAERMSITFWEQRMAEERAALEVAEEGSVDWKTHNKALKDATKNWNEAIKTMNSTVMDALNSLEEWKNSQLDSIQDAFDKLMSRGIGLDQLENEWNLVNDIAGRYLDNVERAVEMDGLDNLFDKALDNANLTAAAQKQINDLRDEEFSKLRDREKISQYDIDLAKSRLNILQQQIALEDAQKNKSNLRLRRDSQGNYNYQYVGDDAQIANAEEGLMSAKGDWYQLVKKRNLDLTNDIIQNRKDLSQALKTYAETDWTNDEEGRQKQLELIALYEQKERDLQWDTENARRDFFDGTAQYFADVEDHDILPQWNTTVNSLINKWADGGEESFTGAVTNGINEITSTQNIFAEKTNEVLTTAGINYKNLYEQGIDPTKQKLEDLVDTNEEFSNILDDINNKLDDYADKLRDIEDAYNSLEDAAASAIQGANEMLRQLANTAVDTVNQINNAINSASSAPSFIGSSNYNSRSGGGSGSGLGSGGGLNSNGYYLHIDHTSAGQTTPEYIVFNANGTIKDRGKIDDYTIDKVKALAKKALNYNQSASPIKYGQTNYHLPKLKGHSIEPNYGAPSKWTLKTGGYTGTWPGSNLIDDYASGRLALLHQKELVLNETDTKNILDAVSAVREMDTSKYSSSIVNDTIAKINSLLNITSELFDKVNTVQSIDNSNSMNYNGDININADFSGVKNADAIYEALTELENYGLQTAYSNLNSQIQNKF